MAFSMGTTATLSHTGQPSVSSISSTASISHLRSSSLHIVTVPWKRSDGYRAFSTKLNMNRRSYKGSLKVTCESTLNMAASTEWMQKTFSLPPFKRGCHIITRYIYEAVPEISQFEVGLANLFILHTSASLTINENASSDVPLDMEDALNRIVPEGNNYRHLDEGYDDMPAHVKASMMGCSLTIPVTAGRFHLGIWQGIWLNEHRDYGGPRRICITLEGKKKADTRKYT
jgi:secondary thiamine-phosphate synthase enzyme